jgi:hypothetical protein
MLIRNKPHLVSLEVKQKKILHRKKIEKNEERKQFKENKILQLKLRLSVNNNNNNNSRLFIGRNQVQVLSI